MSFMLTLPLCYKYPHMGLTDLSKITIGAKSTNPPGEQYFSRMTISHLSCLISSAPHTPICSNPQHPKAS